MNEYQKYLEKVRGARVEADYDKMYSKIMKRPVFAPQIRLAAAAALIVLMFGFAVYFYQAQSISNGDMLISYVLEQQPARDGLIMDYVF